ncbi:MAG: hypothetical protein U0R18_05060 [Mycobacterium sp.]
MLPRIAFRPGSEIRAAAAFGVVAVGTALCLAATASADPAAPPVDPAVPVEPGAPVVAGPPPAPAPLALGPLGATSGATPIGITDFLLGQYQTPSLPGAGPAVAPDVNVLNAGQFLNPLNYRVPTPERVPDQVSPYQLAPATDPGPFARVEAMKGQHAILHGALGRMPIGDLSQPLPGTAPPVGTVLPAGPVQNLPDIPGALPGLVLPPPPPEIDPAIPPAVPQPLIPPTG